MQRFAASGDAIDGLRWALPQVLQALDAEAGSLFLHRPEALCSNVLSVRGVDITGLRVPDAKGLVGRAFTDSRPELVADAGSDRAHYAAADDASGFRPCLPPQRLSILATAALAPFRRSTAVMEAKLVIFVRPTCRFSKRLPGRWHWRWRMSN